jgi:hypothetical protein
VPKFDGFYTVAQAAEATGLSASAIRDLQRQGVIAPALLKGLLQYDRAAIMRLLLFKELQGVFGKFSSVPGSLIRTGGPALDRVLEDHRWIFDGVDVPLADGLLTVRLGPAYMASVVGRLVQATA